MRPPPLPPFIEIEEVYLKDDSALKLWERARDPRIEGGTAGGAAKASAREAGDGDFLTERFAVTAT